jgi:sugar-specific transcriptional regulator TrmB
MYEKELQNLGLSEKEAKVYTTSLELGPDTVQNIAKASGINRATTYVQIGTLKEKGLMSEFEKGKKTYFVAESPNRLKNLLSVIEKELELKKNEAGSVIPGLLSMFESMGERPRVRFFEGLEGAKAMREDFLSIKNKQIESVMNYDKLLELFPNQQTEYSPKRVQKKIASKVLYWSKAGVQKEMTNPKLLRTAKLLKLTKYPLSADFTIYDDKIAVATYKSTPTAVIIESKEIAEAMRALFYVIWDNLK